MSTFTNWSATRSPKLSRKAGEGRLGTPKGRKAIRTIAGSNSDGMPNRTTFDRSRNAEKRGTEAERRSALIDRMARRRRESWKRETRNPAQGRPYGYPVQS